MDYGTEARAKPQPHRRKRVNVGGVLLSLLIPWMIYCSVTAVLGFSIRTTKPALAGTVVLGSVAIVLLAGLTAFRRWQSGDPGREPMWYAFLAATGLLALVLSVSVGQYQWKSVMSGLMNLNNLNTYYHVDPARMRGQQVMDAGTVAFVDKTFLDISKSSGFRNDGTYCVAPITSSNSPLASYDFWAVGRNCCSGLGADFKCGEFNTSPSTSKDDTSLESTSTNFGVRLLEDSERPFYRLAVQQAMATYGIRSDHPLFFKYVSDPSADAAEKYAQAWQNYFAGLLGYFGLQLVLVIGAVCASGKL